MRTLVITRRPQPPTATTSAAAPSFERRPRVLDPVPCSVPGCTEHDDSLPYDPRDPMAATPSCDAHHDLVWWQTYGGQARLVSACWSEAFSDFVPSANGPWHFMRVQVRADGRRCLTCLCVC